MSTGYVYVHDGEVCLHTGATADNGDLLVTAMPPDAAEEMAHALLLCAASARGMPIGEYERTLVAKWLLR